jgi:hypothetical protein
MGGALHGYGSERIRFVSEIKPDDLYVKGCFDNLRFHRGRVLSEALRSDPAAPEALPHPARKSATVYLGRDIIDYLSGYSDEMMPATIEMDAYRAGLDREYDALRIDLQSKVDRAMREAHGEMLRVVRLHLEKATLDITKEAQLSCGVYFLRHKNETVYVGQSVSVHARVATHKKSGKQFDEVLFLPCEKQELNNLEGFFIRLLKPSLNGLSTSGSQSAPSSQLWDSVSSIRLIGSVEDDLELQTRKHPVRKRGR